MVKVVTFLGTAGIWFLGFTIWNAHSRNVVREMALKSPVSARVARIAAVLRPVRLRWRLGAMYRR